MIFAEQNFSFQSITIQVKDYLFHQDAPSVEKMSLINVLIAEKKKKSANFNGKKQPIMVNLNLFVKKTERKSLKKNAKIVIKNKILN